jgi:chromosome segregation ATPase
MSETIESLDDAVRAAHQQTREASRAATRKLKEEIARVDREIAAVAAELRAQTDQAAIIALLDRQAELALSKEKLPLMLRGARALALRAAASELEPVVQEAWRHYELAEEEFGRACAALPEIEAALAAARVRMREAEAARNQATRDHERVSGECADFSVDAARIERGEEPTRPRFDD